MRGIAVGVITAAVVLVLATLPPRAREASGAGWRATDGRIHARGVVHVHTRRSDGSGSIDDVARAAARAGLDFVVVTDHGDATRVPDAPAYHAGVLMIDAVEISTNGGHVLALGLFDAAPFRLGGSPADVVEDVHRLGGRAFAAHPDSPRPSLAWQTWDVPVDGFEWLNGDSEWRDESALGLLDALFHYWLRGPEAIANLLDRPERALERWDAQLREGRMMVALAGADAHARLPFSDDAGEDDNADGGLRVPSYEAVFRAISTHVLLEQRLGDDPRADAARVIDALGRGRTYSVIDGLARGGALEFEAETASGVARMGDEVPPGSLVSLRARARAPVGAEIVLLRNGQVVASNSGVSLNAAVAALPATGAPVNAYRIEVRLDGRRDRPPWIVSNPISDGAVAQTEPVTGPPPTTHGPRTPIELASALSTGGLVVEHDRASSGALRATEAGTGVELGFTLGPTRRGWVAAALALPSHVRQRIDLDSTLSLRLRASAPVRVSVQLRAPSTRDDLRWRRSIYVDRQPATIAVRVGDFEPVGQAAREAALADASTLLVVIDGVNTRPDASGRVVIEDVALEPRRP